MLARLQEVEAVRKPRRQNHVDGHGLPQRAPQPEHRGANHARATKREHRHANHFPAGRTHCERRLFVKTRGLQEHFARDGGDDGQHHNREDNARRHRDTAGARHRAVLPRGEEWDPPEHVSEELVEGLEHWNEDDGAPQSVDHRRNSREQIDEVAEASREFAGGVVGDEQRNANRQRRCDQQCDRRDQHGAKYQEADDLNERLIPLGRDPLDTLSERAG